MTDKKSSESRRTLLKSIAAGSGAIVAGKSLPDSWTKPVVDSVMLPAHAQTSCQAIDDTYTLDPGEPGASVPAPGVLGNDSCTTVVRNTNAVVIQNGPVLSLTVNADGSFQYEVEQEATIFTFTYTTESGATATVTVNHDTLPPMMNCLAHGTPILTPGNRYRAIDSLQIGDLVTAIDQDGTSLFTVVTKVITQHMRSDFYTVNGALRITDDHPVLVERDQSLVWCRVDDLVVGDFVQSLNGNVEIKSLEYHDQPLETVYVETQCGNFIALADSDHYVVKSNYAEAAERLQQGEEMAFA